MTGMPRACGTEMAFPTNSIYAVKPEPHGIRAAAQFGLAHSCAAQTLPRRRETARSERAPWPPLAFAKKRTGAKVRCERGA